MAVHRRIPLDVLDTVHIDLATLSLLGAMQALLLAPLLLAATRVYSGRARTSLRIWSTVLLLQALGWSLLALRGQISDWLSIVLANGVLIVSYAESARALRLLLQVPQRRRALIAIGLVGWLVTTWFWRVQPDYEMRVYVMALVAGSYLSLLVWPLRHALRPGGSGAQRAMLLVLLGVCVTWLLRLGELTFSPALGQGLLTATPVNVLNLFYSAIEPVLASIGFLLMYNESAQAELKRLARTDPLTGALNRLALDEEAERLFRRSATGTGHTCAALMIDVDHFKVINDRYGHAGGDLALMALATRIDQHRRAGDVLGRAGGEEFLMLLPDTGMNEATLVAEGLRTDIETMHLELDGEPQALTISIGVAVREPTDRKFATLIRRADRALYSAKRAGRNRVATSQESTAPSREWVADTL
ncbi:MAG: diguanylate cyclase [Xanthomonadales bacterium]|nr:diguanylate cyclase [Xanthomonadales bacterium]